MHWLWFSISLLTLGLTAQGQESSIRVIAFYNLENLFDTIDDPETYDQDYTPSGKFNYTSDDYRKKLYQLSSVIRDIGSPIGRKGPDILGVSEIENRMVLEDLISVPALDSMQYAIIHLDSPDRRGIDVALIYRKEEFFPLSHEAREVRIWSDSGERLYTRDILWVHGILDAEEIHFLVNHWPSRRGGVSRSSPKRMRAARVNRMIMEEIRAREPDAKIVIMGDFNDDPKDKSLTEGLGARPSKSLDGKLPDSVEMINPMIHLFKKGYNTLVYRDQIHLFDQILLSSNFFDSNQESGLRYRSVGIHNPYRLFVLEGRYKGYPNRSFQNGKYNGGFSDHFPVYVELSTD